MGKADAETTLQELKDLVTKFREERDWNKHFTPKNVATSIAIEAAELLEHFQWDLLMKDAEDDKEEIVKELADVLIFTFHFATIYDIDMASAFRNKLEAVAKKYPVEVFNANNDGKADYHRIKQSYRKGKK